MSDARGFTLLEAAVAFMIAAGAVGVLLQIYGSSATGGERAAEIVRATHIAAVQLERIGREAPLAPGREEGETEDGYRWAVAVETYDEPANVEATPLDLFEVTVTVDRGHGGDLTKLRTLRSQAREARDARF